MAAYGEIPMAAVTVRKMELAGLEPATPCMPCKCSPS
jgi:hypothetical protein